ncbi:hypothetical protein ACFVJQ_32860, partial [Streptomyces sp. NPDC127197]
MRRGIPVRVGIIHLRDGQRGEQARAEMEALGVDQVRVDRVRAVGNAARTTLFPSTSELCGRCADGRAALLPDGTVTPCVRGRFLPAGCVKTAGLKAVFAGQQWAPVVASIPRRGGCVPDSCTPGEDSCRPSPGVVTACNPDKDGSDCSPAETPACGPAYTWEASHGLGGARAVVGGRGDPARVALVRTARRHAAARVRASLVGSW